MRDARIERSWAVLLAVWASFLVFSAVAAPVPGVNEPHYLCKARHFWHPEWCRSDFFLNSPNAHTVFYVTFGALTNLMSFDQTAWVGRALATLILAWGWTRSVSQVFFSRWSTLWCAWVFLAFAACGNFSGEWLVGGVEGKVPAYGFLLAACADMFRRRWRLAALWTGIAVSFHPVVGVWALLAFTASQVTRQVLLRRRSRRFPSEMDKDQKNAAASSRSSFKVTNLWRSAVFQSVLIVFVLALPGMIPVIQLLMEPVSEQTRYEATYIQVYYRLAHHLDPMKFPWQAYVGYLLLLVIWLGSLFWGGRTNQKKELDRIVGWAVLFAILGVAIGYGPEIAVERPYFAERMQLLKFYPFRLADVLLPIAVSISLIALLERTALFMPSETIQRRRIPIPMFAMLIVYGAALLRASMVTEPNRYSGVDRKDWLDACRWIKDHVPVDAEVQSPRNGWAFKWFAERAEFVCYKDCPQDAAGIVEWNRRLQFLEKWYYQKYDDKLYSKMELKELRSLTGMTHLLTDHLGPLELKPVYQNSKFEVFDLTQLDQAP